MDLVSALEVSRFFLSLVREEEGDVMTNLRLQKLLYYAQGFHIALFDELLFPDSIEAWMRGPSVPIVFRYYKVRYDTGIIPYEEDVQLILFSRDVQNLLNEIFRTYGQFSVMGLMQIIQREPPWNETPVGEIITYEAMMDYFKTRILSGWKSKRPGKKNEIDYIAIGRRIRNLRKRPASYFTQAQLANRLEVARTTIVAIEQGKRKLNLNEVAQIASLFRVKTSYLMDGTGDPDIKIMPVVENDI